MFYGQHRHGIDEKGRIIFPAKYREDLGEYFYITRGLDHFLLVYAESEWKKLEDQLKSLPMSTGSDIQRFFFNNTERVSFDKQGRVLLPAHLRSYAGIEKEIVIAGLSNRLEIWDAARYDRENDDSSINPDEVAAKMELLGI